MKREEKGSIELIVLGLLAALIVVLAIPMLTKIGGVGNAALNNLTNEMCQGSFAENMAECQGY